MSVPEVVVEDASGEVYVTWDRGPTWRLTADGALSSQWRSAPGRLPEYLVDIDELCARLARVKMPKTVRVAIAAELGVSPEDIAT